MLSDRLRPFSKYWTKTLAGTNHGPSCTIEGEQQPGSRRRQRQQRQLCSNRAGQRHKILLETAHKVGKVIRVGECQALRSKSLGNHADQTAAVGRLTSVRWLLLSKQPRREDCTTKQQQLQSVGSHRGIPFQQSCQGCWVIKKPKAFLVKGKVNPILVPQFMESINQELDLH